MTGPPLRACLASLQVCPIACLMLATDLCSVGPDNASDDAL